MSMIDDVIEYAHAEGLVLAVVQDDSAGAMRTSSSGQGR